MRQADQPVGISSAGFKNVGTFLRGVFGFGDPSEVSQSEKPMRVLFTNYFQNTV